MKSTSFYLNCSHISYVSAKGRQNFNVQTSRGGDKKNSARQCQGGTISVLRIQEILPAPPSRK